MYTYNSLRTLFSDQAILIRYEDLCLKPEKTANDILHFLGLKENDSIEKFIKEYSFNNIKPEFSNKFKTKRNSSYMAFEWRTHLDDDYIKDIQQSCEDSMRLLGYNPMKNNIYDKLDDNYSLHNENLSIQQFYNM